MTRPSRAIVFLGALLFAARAFPSIPRRTPSAGTFDRDRGGALSAQEPGRGEHKMQYNAAGAVTSETLADGAQQSHDYYNTGSGKAFNDPTRETTGVTTDNIGRPLTV